MVQHISALRSPVSTCLKKPVCALLQNGCGRALWRSPACAGNRCYHVFISYRPNLEAPCCYCYPADNCMSLETQALSVASPSRDPERSRCDSLGG